MEDKDKLACRLARIICTLMIWLEGEWEVDDKFARGAIPVHLWLKTNLDLRKTVFSISCFNFVHRAGN
jgi:hypothetical protein